MDILALLIVIAALLFLLFVGVYGDMTRRTSFPITGRVGFLLAPIAYVITIIAVFLPVVYFAFYPLVFMDLSSAITMVIPLGLGAFGLLVVIGAFPLWLLHHNTATFKQCLVNSVDAESRYRLFLGICSSSHRDRTCNPSSADFESNHSFPDFTVWKRYHWNNRLRSVIDLSFTHSATVKGLNSQAHNPKG